MHSLFHPRPSRLAHHPDRSEEPRPDQRVVLFIEAMGGNKNKTMKEGEDKIIKKISKLVLIDKKLI